MSPKISDSLPFLKTYKKRLLMVGLILVFLFLIMDLNSRLSELENLEQERDRVAIEATAIYETQTALETQVAYAKSGEAVKDYAEDQQMTNNDGRVLVIPLPDTRITPTPRIVATSTPVVFDKIEIWKELFFGD